MKAVVQRVSGAKVTVNGETVGSIDEGLFVLLGVSKEDTAENADKLASKIAKMRIFSENDKLTNSVIDINGGILTVSNFTLYGNCKKGNRPDFMASAGGKEAWPLYLRFVDGLIKNGVKKCETGRFGEDMKVQCVCDGPVTIVIDSNDL